MRLFVALVCLTALAAADSSVPQKKEPATPAHGQPRHPPPPPPPWRCRGAIPIPPEPIADCDPVVEEKREPRTTLARCEIVGNIERVKSHVNCCFQAYGKPGLATATVTVGENGVPTKVTVAGAFAETGTAYCIENAVRQARFPAFQGKPLSFTYPFVLH
jgi:hypothetical protein